MTEKDITQIRIGQHNFGIIGIKRLMVDLAATHADKADEEIQAVMLEGLGRDNYIPAHARNDYGRAFVREFRKFMGQPQPEETPQGLDIKVLGTGCAQCHHLVQTIMGVLSELNLPAGVDHVTDFKEIARYGVMGAPALLINGRVKAVGSVPPKNRIKQWLLEAG